MKYIIEIPDYVLYVLLKEEVYGKFITKVVPVADLEELNSDYINKNFGSLQDGVYQAGMNKAWEAAQKVVCKTTVGGMSLDTLQEVFGVPSPAAIMQSNTAQQAIDKIKAYEQKQTKRDIENDIDYLMQSTGMTVEEIAQRLKEMRN